MAYQLPLRRLFSPIVLNRTEIRNRLVLPAMHLGYTPGGFVSEKLTDFYLERAQGGVGMIIIGGCTIDEYSGMSGPRERQLSRLAEILAVIQPEGRVPDGEQALATDGGMLARLNTTIVITASTDERWVTALRGLRCGGVHGVGVFMAARTFGPLPSGRRCLPTCRRAACRPIL